MCLAEGNQKQETGVSGPEVPRLARRYAVTDPHLPGKEKVERAEAAVLETLVFGGLIVSAVAAAIYDIGLWFGAW
jgi:hypothetical protein